MILLSKQLILKTIRFDVKTSRSLCLSHTKCYQSINNRPKNHSKSSIFVENAGHPYDQLFPWKSLSDFAHYLADNVVYFDGHLLAISKPWGVGTYKPNINITNKNSYLSTAVYSGSSRYCLLDSLDYLCQILGIKKLKIIKTINRFMSGIVLMTTDETTENSVLKAIRRSQAMESPSMNFWCVTKGWPTIDGNHLKERVGIKLLELDELGDHKQPIIINAEQLTNNMRRRKKQPMDGLQIKPALIELKPININKTLGVSLVELSTHILKWNFIECYLAFKTSFVLGDTRFCRQVKHVLGTPLSVKPDKLNFTQDYEPLPPNILNKLLVRANGQIPVHIHHKRLVLPFYLSRKDKKDLIIETNKIPDYFDWSLKKLEIQALN